MANPYVLAGVTIGGVTLLTGLGAWWARKAKAEPAPVVTPANLANQVLFAWKQSRLGNKDVAERVMATAQQTATALGLMKTAAALKAGTALPLDENWPGTNMSVNAYLKEADAKASNPAAA